MALTNGKKAAVVAVLAVLVCSAAIVAFVNGHQSSDDGDDDQLLGGSRTIVPSKTYHNSGVFKIGDQTYRAGETITIDGTEYLVFGGFGGGLQLVRINDYELFNWKDGALEDVQMKTQLDFVDEDVIIDGQTYHVGVRCHRLTIVDWKSVPGPYSFWVLTLDGKVVGTYDDMTNNVSFNDLR